MHKKPLGLVGLRPAAQTYRGSFWCSSSSYLDLSREEWMHGENGSNGTQGNSDRRAESEKGGEEERGKRPFFHPTCGSLYPLTSKKRKEAYSSLCYKHRTTTGTHAPYGITQCYLPPGRGDIPAFTPAN